MGWFTRFDRFGGTHLVFSQEQGMSCSMASAKMITFKVNKLKPGTDALVSEAQVEKTYKKYDTAATDVGRDGVDDLSHFPALFAKLGLGKWTYAEPGLDQIAGLTIAHVQKAPVLLAAFWTGGGGHAVVADDKCTIPKLGTYLTVCDPWDGNVHVIKAEKGKPLHYNVQPVKFSWSIGTPEQGGYDKAGNSGLFRQIVYKA